MQRLSPIGLKTIECHHCEGYDEVWPVIKYPNRQGIAVILSMTILPTFTATAFNSLLLTHLLP